MGFIYKAQSSFNNGGASSHGFHRERRSLKREAFKLNNMRRKEGGTIGWINNYNNYLLWVEFEY